MVRDNATQLRPQRCLNPNDRLKASVKLRAAGLFVVFMLKNRDARVCALERCAAVAVHALDQSFIVSYILMTVCKVLQTPTISAESCAAPATASCNGQRAGPRDDD